MRFGEESGAGAEAKWRFETLISSKKGWYGDCASPLDGCKPVSWRTLRLRNVSKSYSAAQACGKDWLIIRARTLSKLFEH